MPTPTAFEQELLEMINRARLDPAGEFDALIVDAASQTGASAEITNALRYFGVDATAFGEQMAAYDAVAPLAWNLALSSAAQDHSDEMIAADAQSHQLPGESGLGDRISAAGYNNWTNLSENVYAYTKSALYGHAGFVIDWGYDDEDYSGNSRLSDWQTLGDGMQDPAGHRNTIMSATLTEVGIAAVAENNNSTSVGPYVVTQDFGSRWDYAAQLLGVVIEDQDGDRFYDAGEGLGGITVTITNSGGQVATTTTWSSGGYQVSLSPGSYTVDFSGAGLSGSIQHQITMGSENLKLDAFAADAAQGADAGDNDLTGTGNDDTLDGLAGNDTLNGLDGDDSLLGGDDDDWITPGAGNDTVDGGTGSDMVSFVDLGAGVIVNLQDNTAQSGADTKLLTNIENVTGTIYGDFIRGDDGDNRLRGLGNYDWIVGSEGADYIDGGSGRDMVSYVYSDAAVTVDLGAGRGSAGQADGDRYESIERVTGSVYSDLFYGSSGEDEFRGLGGYDWFVGSDGGRDRYDGGSGYDTVAYSSATSGVTASLLLGRGSGGDAESDLYTSIESLTGSSFDDMLTGDSGRNILRGMYGEDTILGGGGVDYITGGGSDDYLDGGSGWDAAIYSGNRADYTVTQNASGVTVSALSGGEGIDELYNFEAIQFADDLMYL
ncbi:CAP domain-containing protein [Rhodobacteraceae bacterium D3-12]|nr:CAP domain-containing protein [Rhodobacteraceae bacterium D3-12]